MCCREQPYRGTNTHTLCKVRSDVHHQVRNSVREQTWYKNGVRQSYIPIKVDLNLHRKTPTLTANTLVQYTI